MPAIKPSRVDAKLVKSFEDAVSGRGDGRVSVKDVRESIVPRFADAGRLTKTEKATLAWAVDAFNLSDAAKRELSAGLTALTGGPVFEWQRQIGGAVGVQLDGGLTRGELDKKAAASYSDNARPLSSDWDTDAFYAHPESGNGGTHLMGLDGENAERQILFLANVLNEPSIKDRFSTDTHAVYSVYESGDEEEYGGLFVDKKTGEATAFDTYNMVDLTYDLNREQFEEIFGPVVDDHGNRVADADYEDAVENVEWWDSIPGAQGREIEVPFFSAAQEARRRGPLRDASKTLYDAFKASGDDRKGAYNYGVLARVGNLEDRLPALIDEVHMTEWRDREKPNTTPTVNQAFCKLDADARSAMEDTLKAVIGGQPKAKLDQLLEGLGTRRDLQYAQVELPMTVRDGADRDLQHEIDVTAHIVVNEKDGDWFVLYERESFGGD